MNTTAGAEHFEHHKVIFNLLTAAALPVYKLNDHLYIPRQKFPGIIYACLSVFVVA